MEMMLSGEKKFSFLVIFSLFYAGNTDFGLVSTGLYSGSSSPGFPFGCISVASGDSSSYSHFIVAHLIISEEVPMYGTGRNYFAQIIFVGL